MFRVRATSAVHKNSVSIGGSVWQRGMIKDNRIHVVPLDDLKPHTEGGEWCACAPRVEAAGGGKVVIHNAYDGREFYEPNTQEAKTTAAFQDGDGAASTLSDRFGGSEIPSRWNG